MDTIIELLTGYGYTGMFIASLLAGSVLPFSSEAVMVGLIAAGLDPWLLALYGTIGNVIGSMVNYWVGHMGKTEWFERYLNVKQRDMERAERFMAGRGALMGFFAFVPVIGSAITVLLGLMRANLLITFLSVTAGKIVRYVILIYGAGMFL